MKKNLHWDIPISYSTTVLSVNIWQKMELEPEPKLWTKVEPEPESEPKINNFVSATLAETPIFWAAPDPDVWCPGANSGSGSRQKRRLRLQAKKGGSMRLRLMTLKFLMSALKNLINNTNYFGSYCLYKLHWLHVYILQEEDLSFLLSNKIQEEPEPP